MDRTRDQFLTGPALAAQQDRGLAPRDASDSIEERAHRRAAPHHVVLDVDFPLQQLVRFLKASCLAVLLAGDRRERRQHEQKPDVPGVESHPRRRFSPKGPGGPAEGDHRKDNRVAAIGVHHGRDLLFDNALDQARIDRHGSRTRRRAPRRPDTGGSISIAREDNALERRRFEHEPGKCGVERREAANGAEGGAQAQQRFQIALFGRRAVVRAAEHAVVESDFLRRPQLA